jgi:ribosomal-protein-alanine N-acetyltransferase
MRQLLETDRLKLRELSLDDLGRMYSILSDPVTMQFWPKPFDLESAERWIKRSIEAYRELGFGRYAVVLKSSGDLIGDCGFMRAEVNGVQENDLGYIIDKRFWGRRYATEAAKACLRHGLENLKMKRIVASMETKHLASKAVAEKIGLKFEREFINSRNRNLPTALLSIETDY